MCTICGRKGVMYRVGTKTYCKECFMKRYGIKE